MKFVDLNTARRFSTVLLLLLFCAAVYAARWVVLLFIVAMLVAYLLDPLVRFLQHHSLFLKDLRGPAVVKVYLVLLILASYGLHALAPDLTKKPGKLIQNVSTVINGFSNGDVAVGIGSRAGWSHDEAARLKTFLADHRAQIDKLINEIEQTLPSVLEGALLVPILAIFFLRDGRTMVDDFIEVSSRWHNRESLQALASNLDTALREYIRTKVTLGGLSLIFYCLTLLVLRIPNAFALSVLGAMLEFIPVLGWVSAAAVILSVAILSQSHWILLAILLGLWRLAQDYVNAPRVMVRHLEINSLISMFGIMAGWDIGGIMGVYLSVPLMAVMSVIWRSLRPQTEETHNQIAASGQT